MMGTFSRWRGHQFASIAGIGVSLVLLFFLYFWRLGTLTPGLSPPEAASRTASSSFHQISQNPINAPHKLLQLGLAHIGHGGIFWLRLTSVLFFMLFLVLLAVLLRFWFGSFIGLLGAGLFAATPFIILLARSASSDVMYLAPAALASNYTWFTRTHKNMILAWLLLMITVALSIYTPGVIWIVVAASLIGFKSLRESIQSLGKGWLTAGVMLFLLLLSFLVFGLGVHTDLIKSFFLIPQHFSAGSFIKDLGWAFMLLFSRAPHHLDYLVGRMAILDVAQTVLAIIGFYALWKEARRAFYILVSMAIVGLLGAAFTNNFVLTALGLPALAMAVAAGLRMLYVRWSNVFPRNPLPRGLAFALMVALAITQIYYAWHYSLAAWPHTLDTHTTYVLK